MKVSATYSPKGEILLELVGKGAYEWMLLERTDSRVVQLHRPGRVQSEFTRVRSKLGSDRHKLVLRFQPPRFNRKVSRS